MESSDSSSVPRLAQRVHSEAAPASGRAHQRDGEHMRGLLRTLLAGYGAKKMGGGCISTIIIFLILYFLLRGVGI
jgi:hypothetical protein